ncbi:sirtuin-like protein [Aureococcus anophagefferens]|nr:sirtuin-like protein [Aureococcus anophagefferens]
MEDSAPVPLAGGPKPSAEPEPAEFKARPRAMSTDEPSFALPEPSPFDAAAPPPPSPPRYDGERAAPPGGPEPPEEMRGSVDSGAGEMRGSMDEDSDGAAAAGKRAARAARAPRPCGPRACCRRTCSTRRRGRRSSRASTPRASRATRASPTPRRSGAEARRRRCRGALRRRRRRARRRRPRRRGHVDVRGHPDFRSPARALDNLQKYDLPHPQAIFSIDYFRERPGAFYELCRELWPGTYAPTATHLFIKLLHDKGRLLRCFTQNIDSLETAAGLPPDRVVAAHGNFDGATCIDTGAPVAVSEVKAAVDGASGWAAALTAHGGLVKPDIVFFGEGLPRRFFELANRDLPRCRLLLVIGTSLSVQPFASLVGHVDDDCVRVLVNRDAVGRRDPRIPLAVARQLGIGGGLEFDDESRNYRDVKLLGACDDQVRELAAELGWADDLADLEADAEADFARRKRRAEGDPGPRAPPRPDPPSDRLPPSPTLAGWLPEGTTPLPDAPLLAGRGESDPPLLDRDARPALARAESASAQLAAAAGLSLADDGEGPGDGV